MPNFNIYCCNPFAREQHKTVKNLRTVQNWMIEVNPNIKTGMKICDTCRKQLEKEKDTPQTKAAEEVQDSSDKGYFDPHVTVEYLNKSLSCIEESPISKKRMRSSGYLTRKLQKVKNTMTEKLLGESSSQSEEIDNPDQEILFQLKEKFEQTQSRSEKIQVLTILPNSWSCKRIEEEFKVSNRMARKAKALVKEKGILSTPDPKPGKTLDTAVAQNVADFYNSDDVSRIMPGKKDFVSIITKEHTRAHVQKRLILGNLKEIYQLFKSRYPTEKIGLSKFAELRPKNCILAGGAGTHSVCVCTTHQNVKLMITGAQLQRIVLDDDSKLSDHKTCLSKIMCSPSTSKCHLDNCDICPGTDHLKEQLMNKLENDMIDNITYKQWISVDRCSLETVTKSTEEFVNTFCEKLLALKKHSFIARQQSAYFSHLKDNIKMNEVLISLDFSENYLFVLQDAAQSFHWNNSQATLHPIAVFYRDQDGIKYKSFVFISECLTHNTVAVHLFQRKLISYLKSSLIPSLEKIFYFSDGSSAQYKNRKNFHNLCHHILDFGVTAEWHFYATAHGKGVCDGLGGTVKRLAARASLHRPYTDQIMTPTQLFDWSTSNIPSIKFFYTTNQEHLEEEDFLKSRFSDARKIRGTRQFHGFIPFSTTRIITKIYSFSKASKKYFVEGSSRTHHG